MNMRAMKVIMGLLEFWLARENSNKKQETRNKKQETRNKKQE
jgi:hypothetical protein